MMMQRKNRYKRSNNMAKLKYGIGISSKGKYRATVNNKMTAAYAAWSDMFRRCYCRDYQNKYPAYIGCSVDKRWHDFQDFAEWYYNQPYSDKGYHLDKDLLVPNNKIYSPENCCFVPTELNNLLLSRAASRGKYPQGVCFHKPTGKYRAAIRINTKSHHLGHFDCPFEAHQVYKVAKERYVKNKALEWANRIDWNVFKTLMTWSLQS